MASQSNSAYDVEWSSDDDYDIIESVEGEERRKNYEYKRNATIYLLDSRQQMFSGNNLIEGKAPFIQCLKCIRSAMRSKIWASDKSLCAFVLLGIKKTDNPLSLKNIMVVQGLKMLSAEHIFKLDNITKQVEESIFEMEYGHGDFSLADVFWLCSKLFNDCGKNMNLCKTIVLYTNDDNPTKNNHNELNRILNSARDMMENKIMFNLIHLGEKFNVNNLYKELIQLSRADMDYEIPKPAVTLKEMIDQHNKIQNSHHVSFSNIPFHITSNFVCEVSVYYFARKLKPPFKVKLSKATNEMVTTKRQFFETETGEVVSKHKLAKCYNYGGKEIVFTMNELKHIEKLSEKGLRLMGFKPGSTVNLEHFVKPCAFIYPSNIHDAGSSAFFVALLTRCLDKQVVPICTFCSRSGSSMEYVALIATEEETDADKTQIVPPGFLVFFLPFADDVRDLDEKCTGKERAGKAEVELAKKLVKKLKFDYRPEIFPSPKLASHWSGVEALALNLKEPEPFIDSTLPQYDIVRSRTEAVANDLRDAIYSEGYDPEGAVPRPRAKPLTLSKDAETSFQIDVDNVEAILKSGEVHKLTNNTLKLFLQQVGQGSGLSKAKKSDLIKRSCKYLNIPLPQQFMDN